MKKIYNKYLNNSEVQNKKGGFAILFAVLVGGIVLTIGMSIFNLTIKELLLSSASRESQSAFYAADTGMECVFYWDNYQIDPNYNAFATSSDSTNPSIQCVDNITNKSIISSNSTAATTTFTVNFGALASPCANVTVAKYLSGSEIKTTVISKGYNTCDTTDPTRIERALKAIY